MSPRQPGSGERRSGSAKLARFLLRIRQGDAEARNDFLTAYAPLALSVAAKAVGRYVRLGEDEEASVALIALDEAARGFAPERGAFVPFASQVVRRRIIDHLRREGRRAPEIPAGVGYDPGGAAEAGEEATPQLAAAVAEIAARGHAEGEARRDELMSFRHDLAEYGLDLAALVRVAPQHHDAREGAKAVARVLAADPELRRYLQRRKQLPLRELADRSGLSRKSIERHRKYIVAVALILIGEYEHLSEYVAGTGVRR